MLLGIVGFRALAATSSGAAVEARAMAQTTADTTACPWLNQSLPVAQRVSMLMGQMTLADKMGSALACRATE